MAGLTNRERELAALGAAMGSNCIPCIEHHIPEARKAGLSDAEVLEAVRLADEVRQVPARKVLSAAMTVLDEGQGSGSDSPTSCPASDRPTATADGSAGCC